MKFGWNYRTEVEIRVVLLMLVQGFSGGENCTGLLVFTSVGALLCILAM